MVNQVVRFLQTNEEVTQTEQSSEESRLKTEIIAAMRSVYDPEISVNIYDLGLIYAIKLNGQGDVSVDMTLTSPACPVAGSLPGQVECAIKTIKGVNEVQVNLVWDPPWGQECMTDDAKLTLGLY